MEENTQQSPVQPETQPAPQPQPVAPQQPMMDDQKDVEENKIIAALSYLGILVLIPLLAKRESKFAQFHAKQGIVLLIGQVVSPFLIPLFGVGALLLLVILVFSIMGLINALTGQTKKLPLVGDWAEKFNI